MGPIALTVLTPLVGALLLALAPRARERDVKTVGLGVSLATFAASLWMLASLDLRNPDLQLAESYTWIPSIGARFAFAVDGVSVALILLTTFLVPIVLAASWSSIKDRLVGYTAAFLVLEAAVIGVFATTDLLLFYVLFEFTLVPMYLIIGIWGGAGRRAAAVKFFLYTLAGGLLMLVGILSLHAQTGTFDYVAIRDAIVSGRVVIGATQQVWLFAAFLVAFAVKVPIFPVHTWLPDAHTEAPTGGSVFLAGVLLKMGTFGLLRYAMPLFPDATVAFAPWLIGVSVVGVLYGAIVALMQDDVKRLVAYSSVSHMGFVVLGTFALNDIATSAAVVQMVNHGLSTGALFLMIGFLYERRHTRRIADFGGLAKQVPVMAGLWLVVSMSSLALPGLNGFVGEFPILLGAFAVNRPAAVLAAFGAVLAALYLLWAYQRIFHGPLETDENRTTTDLTRRELVIMAPLIALIVAIGLYPGPLFDLVGPSVDRVLAEVAAVAGGVR
jgi:NADH-quinone oxidoreductase subunit M